MMKVFSLYSVLAGLDPRSHLQPNCVTNYVDMISDINLEGITLSVSLNQIGTFWKK